MNDTLKVAGRIGAELGAAKAELERLSHKLERARDHLTHARHDVEIRANAGNDAARLVLKGIDQWLSDYDQSPTDTFTAVDMATAAAQGFRDGQAAVEPAPAQDTLMAGCLLPPRMICEDGYPSDDYLMSTAYNRALDDVAALNATCSQPASAQDEREECGCTAERRLVGEGCHVCNLDDDIHQLAFEVGDPADDASGYWFDMESFSEFVEKLLPVIREPYEDVLRALACTLGAGGYNAPTVDPSVFEQKIRWGIDQLTRHTQTEQQPIEGIHRNAYPAKCPVTGLPYFMHLEHPELGVIPTFGGPYDSYSIPHAEGSPDEPWHQRELVSHRYCHDRGHWVDDEFIPLRIIHEDVLSELQDSAAPIAQTAQLVVPDECPHMIVFDDAERENELFAGCGARSAAMRRWEQISQSWNAHLFVRIERNSRDDRHPNAVAAPQPEQSGKFAMGDLVRKTSGSEWQGRICGTYSTTLTPEGYAVESEAHAGSVQIYPAKALEAVE